MKSHDDPPCPSRQAPRGSDAKLGRIIRFPRAGPSRTTREDILHEVFEARADMHPDTPAVVAGRRSVSYAELDEYANRIARHLWSRGVRRGSRVAVLLRRSATAHGAILGILKVGAAYVALDPCQPPDRTARVLEMAGTSALVTTSAVSFRHRFQGQVVYLDSDRKAIAAESGERLRRDLVRIDPDDLCSVVYDLDIDGHPQGVMIEHRSACHLAHVAGETFGIRPWDRVYQASPLHAAESMQEVWLAFNAGATLVAPAGRSGLDAAKHLAKARVTVLSCSPDRLSLLTSDVPTLRLLILRGGDVSEHLVARWTRADRRIVSTYGHAETTVMATYSDLLPGRPVTLGRPLPGCRVYLMDPELRFVRCGQVGEICVGGLGVARGYLGLPTETCARFVHDPLASGGSDARMYRTGELGRIGPNGNLEYHGTAGPNPVVPSPGGWR